MGNFKRSIVVITLITFLTATMPFQVLASDINTKSEKIESNQSKTKEEITEAEKAAVKVVKEVEEKRESNIKHYLLEDKTYEAVIYNYPVHYFEDGQWKDIDNSLSETIDKRILDEELTNEQEAKEGSKVEEKKTSEDESKKESSSEIKAPEVENKEIPKSEVKTSEGKNKEVPKVEEKPDTKTEETKNKSVPQDNVQASSHQNNPSSQVEKNNSNDNKSSNNNILNFGKSKGKEEEKVFENKSNSFKFKLAKKGDSKRLVTISKDKYEISWSLENAAKVTGELSEYNEDKINKEIEEKANGIVNNSKNASLKSKSEKNLEKQNIVENEKKKTLPNITSGVNFRSILKDVDLNYQLISDRVKENLIINKNIKDTTFTYNMEVKNLIAVKQEDNSVIFYDKEDKDKEVFLIKAPFMFDSKGIESTDIQVKVEETKKGYSLTLIPSREWLNDKGRAYPVTIDPDVTTELDRDKITDTFITSIADPDNKYNNQYLRVGNHNTIGTTRSLLKFSLPTITSAEMVIRAQLELYLNEAPAKNQINVHKVTSNWNADASHNLGWSNQPSFNAEIEDYNIVSGSEKWVSWDVTEIAKSWYVTGNNYGLMLKSDNESVANSSFWSSDIHDVYKGARPRVKITYVNNSGLEDYWTYHSQDVGRAGTGFINDYNGNLIFTHNDLSMNGNKMPVNISHVYNSNFKGPIDSNNPNYSYGNGWRLNLNQRVYSEVIEGKNYYVYLDGDGTKHYLIYDSTIGKWKDESGIDITLTVNSGTSGSDYYIIKDKKDNKLTFYSGGNLYQIVDNNNNTLTVGYTGPKITSITDGAGRITTFNVDSNGYLTSIVFPKSASDPNERKIIYSYTGNLLTKITYPDGKSVGYSYDSNSNLTEATDIDGYKIKYDYTIGSVKRVSKISELYKDGIAGQSLNINYGNNITTFVDSQNRKNIFQFNNQGNTISATDADKSAMYYKHGEATNNKNKLLLNSKMQKSILNYVINHNLEESSNDWYSVHWGGSTGTAGYDNTNPYIGNQSFKVTKTNNLGISLMEQQLNLPKGKTYTFSGYIKTDSITKSKAGGALLIVTYQNNAGVWQQIETGKVVGSSSWNRYEAQFTLPADAASGQVFLKAGISEEKGTAYFDAFQIEEGKIANRYNLVENPSFTVNNSPSFRFWNADNADTGDGVVISSNTNYPMGLDNSKSVYKLNGVEIKNKNIYQYIKVQGKKGDVFTAAGWAQAESVPLYGERHFGLDVAFKRKDGSMQYKVLPFNEDSSEWQYICDKVIADSDYTEVLIFGLYYQNANTVQFDGFQLYKEEFGQSYQYDAKGNIVSTVELDQKNSQFEYSAKNDLVKYVDPKGSSFNYEYDDKHNIKKSTTSENVVYSFTYDSSGNPKEAKVSDVSDTNRIISSAEYDSKGNYIKSLTDSSGNKVSFDYDEYKGTLKSTTDPKGKTTSYEYDANTDALKSVIKSVDGTNIRNSYTYENDRIKTINHNGFDYTFEYDNMGNNSAVYVGNQKLITNSYESKTRDLLQSEYGNKQKITFSYDILGRIKGKRYNSETKDRFNYEYDASGNLGYKYDDSNNVSYRYIYDISDRLVKINDSKGNIVSYTYDSNNNLSKLTEKVNSISKSTSYSYDKDNKLKSVAYESGAAINKNYDSLGRVDTTTLNNTPSETNFITKYTYEKGNNTSTTTNKVSSIDNYKSLSEANGNSLIKYTYDANGNIETITQGGKVIKYYYNELGELKREDNQVTNKTITYSYDIGGNITSKVEYPYTTTNPITVAATSTINYGYADTNWKDKLTSYNGKAITYDEIGNPLTYDGYTYTWEMGRQLKSINKTGQTIAYKYEDSGIRTEKTVNGVKTSYNLIGDKVTCEDNGTDKIYYTYDANGKLLSMNLRTPDSYSNDLYELVGSETAIQLSGSNSAAEKFNATKPFDRVSVNCPSWSNNIGNLTLSLYKWKTDYNTTISASPIASKQFQNYTDNQWLELKVNEQSSVEYLWVLSNPSENVGVWKSEGSTNSSTAYLNGSVVSGDYTSKISYKTNEYYYIRNAQGDIIGLIDENGTQVVSYTYDSWGNLISIDGTLKDTVGVKNPYRYRGYRYDTETGLYYLQSRYYNPEWGRFINADALGGQAGELLSHNVFAYCKNNPVTAKDPSGFRPVYTMDEETDSMREASYKRMNSASQVASRYKSHNQYKGSSTWVKEKGARMKSRAAITFSGSLEEAKKLTNERIGYLSGGLIVLGTSTIVSDKKGRNAGVCAGLLVLFTDTFVSKGDINAMAITPLILGKNYLMYTTGVIFESFDNVTNDPNSFNNFHPRGCDR